MSHEISITNSDEIQSRIFTIRGFQVMVDRNLAELYGVKTRVLNQAVKRNIGRFPDEFMFQLTKAEFEDWKSQIVISNKELMGLRKAPYVFTEAGVSMLSAVLKSGMAIRMSVEIIRAFVQMRRFIANNASILRRLDTIEQKQRITDTKLGKVFEAIEANDIKPTQGIFFDGQIFDAYLFFNDLIRRAKSSIVLIDNFVDDTVLMQLSKRTEGVSATILTKTASVRLRQDLKKHNAQYASITVLEFTHSHDRFLILDGELVYHIGASLKDLGKKWFAFSRMDKDALAIMERIESVLEENVCDGQ